MTRITLIATPDALGADAAPEMVIVDDGQSRLFGLALDPTQKTEHYYPFTLTRGGAVDFGYGYDRLKEDRAINERHAHLDLFATDGAIRKSGLITFKTDTYEQKYRIKDDGNAADDQ